MPARMRISVVLPAPFGPSKPNMPFPMVRLMSRNACTLPLYVFANCSNTICIGILLLTVNWRFMQLQHVCWTQPIGVAVPSRGDGAFNRCPGGRATRRPRHCVNRHKPRLWPLAAKPTCAGWKGGLSFRAKQMLWTAERQSGEDKEPQRHAQQNQPVLQPGVVPLRPTHLQNGGKDLL